MNKSSTPWADISGTRERLRGTQRYDIAIVGAGLTGLSAALRVLELDPNRRVAVIEADRVAAGASGRGTGLLGPRIGPALRVARRRYGDDTARKAHLWSMSAVRYVRELVDTHDISCDLVPGSQLIVASSWEDAAAQEREADAARALGLDIELVSGYMMPPLARRYKSGLRYAPAATLDPAALAGSLAQIGEQAGLTIFERSPVRDIRRGLLTTVASDEGAIVCEHLILATNAFGFPGSPPGIVGARVQAGVTEKLTDAARDGLGSLVTEPLIGYAKLSPYFRLTADDRLIVGGGSIQRGLYGSAAPLPGRLQTAVRRLSPLTDNVKLEAAWAGPIAVTVDGLPVVGCFQNDPNVYYASGCNGHGLAAAVYIGARLAEGIVREGGALGGDDIDGPALPWLRSRPPWIPRGRILDRVLDSYLARLTSARA